MMYKRSGRAISMLAATLAATIILAFLAGCSSGRPDATAQRGVAANVISPTPDMIGGTSAPRRIAAILQNTTRQCSRC